MDRGGKLLVYLDIVLDAKGTRLITTGLEEFLRKYGVLAGSDFALSEPFITVMLDFFPNGGLVSTMSKRVPGSLRSASST